MSVKGELKDISLTGLIQMICMEQRNAALLVRHQHIEEGILFFEDGEIVHARTGKLEGEAAVYHLLSWEDGSFRMGEGVSIPRRTINSSWRFLLLEGMRKIDEASVGMDKTAVSAPPLTATQITKDEQLEMALISLLSQMEFGRAEIDKRFIRKRPSQLLNKLAHLLNITFVSLNKAYPATSYNLKKNILICQETFPALRLLTVTRNQLVPREVETLYSNWSSGKNSRKALFLEMVQGMTEVLEAGLMQYVTHFHDNNQVQQWRNTCRVFLADLNKSIAKVKF